MAHPGILRRLECVPSAPCVPSDSPTSPSTGSFAKPKRLARPWSYGLTALALPCPAARRPYGSGGRRYPWSSGEVRSATYSGRRSGASRGRVSPGAGNGPGEPRRQPGPKRRYPIMYL